MSVYDINGNPIATDGDLLETPYLSSSSKNRLREQSDFDMSSFDVIKIFTPFSTDYSTNTSTPKVLNITSSEFYSTFYEQYLGYHDDLLVTKKNLGKDQSGAYDIWCYDFIPYNAKRKIMLSSGMHTYELPASFGLALWIKNYMESSDAVFQYMRQNVQISVVPIVNPWGFNQTPQKKYGNADGVNINRNFDNWENVWATFPEYSPDPSSPNYNEWNVKGDEPFSEAETKILCTWAKNNTDADFWIDCHTGVNNSRADFGDVWYTVISDNVNLSKIQAAASALMTHLQDVYGRTPKLYAVVDSANSIRQKYSDAVVGVPTMTIEQPQYSDTVYQTVPNNCSTAIKEYATNIHAYIVSQLQGYIPIVSNRLYGEKLSVIGDSYVSGTIENQTSDMWWYKIAERNSMTATNLGVGGESLRVMVQSNRYQNIPSDSDYICVFSGNNDTNYDYTPVGESTDTGNTTFYGCLDILCKWLMENRPLARKLFITPMHRSATVDYTPYINAIKEVCYRYSIPCWDAFGGLDILINGASGVTQSVFETTNLPVHLNALGQDYLSYKVEEQLKML